MMNRIIVTGGSGFIGTHLIADLLGKKCVVINLDICAPKEKSLNALWKSCNILDDIKLKQIFEEFQPTHVVHLAARTTTDGKSLDDYPDNTTGTKNILDAIQETSGIQRVVITSSQHVRKPGSGLPNSDTDYNSHGFYGKSKVLTEELTRKANLPCEWVIIRPTTIWGPYHFLLAQGLWNVLQKGLYVHPLNDPVLRSYGYVKNTVWQIEKILSAPQELVHKKTFYIGDPVIKQIEWVNAFSIALRGQKALQIPKQAIFILALIGDMLNKLGIKFPINSTRFFNLTTDNPVPLEPIHTLFGIPPFSLEEGIQETIEWLKANNEQKLQESKNSPA
jgi:nucleoside-diphosphate-sugar epimerase